MLRSFELISGLKVNFHKSYSGLLVLKIIFWRGMLPLWIARLQNYILLSWNSIGANPRKEETWKPIVVKVTKRLSSWKHGTLGGRVCIINSVISFLPLFYMCFIKVSLGVVTKIERLQRNFNENERKINWARWEKVCRPKEHGG